MIGEKELETLEPGILRCGLENRAVRGLGRYVRRGCCHMSVARREYVMVQLFFFRVNFAIRTE